MSDKLEVVEESDGLGGYVYVIKEQVEGKTKEVFFESADNLSDKWCHYGDLPSPAAYINEDNE